MSEYIVGRNEEEGRERERGEEREEGYQQTAARVLCTNIGLWLESFTKTRVGLRSYTLLTADCRLIDTFCVLGYLLIRAPH